MGGRVLRVRRTVGTRERFVTDTAYPYEPLRILDIRSWEGGSRWTKAWLVHSETRPGTWYVVEYLDRRLSCSCPFGLMTHQAFLDGLDPIAGKGCKHLRAVVRWVQAQSPPSHVPPVNAGMFVD